jgi:pimeloyl-ACP methyl ester carboxylesterase
MTMQEKFVRANGVNIHYAEAGSGTPLILLHGGSSTLAEWRAHIPTFAKRYRVLALDSRGHGKTDNPAGKLSYRMMAEDVAAFIETLELSRPFVCGYSDGGQIALELAIRRPGLARGAMVGAAWYRFTEGYVNSLKSWGIERPGKMDFAWLEANFADFVRSWKRDHHRDDDPNHWQSLLLQISEMWLTPLDYTEADFRQITEPVLVLIGDRDGMIPLEQAFEMYRMIPTAELAVLPNADHLGVIMNPGIFIRILQDFLARHDKSDSKEQHAG